MKSNNIIIIAVLIVVIIGGFIVYNQLSKMQPPFQKPGETAASPLNASYKIEGQKITLVNGKAEKEIVPGSASKILVNVFDANTKGDVNGDGLPDNAVLLTYSAGGSGTLYYIAAAVKTDQGYKGSDALFLGDRISPQTTEIKNGQIIVNYAERRIDQSMVTPPSIGISRSFALDGATLTETTTKDAKEELACAILGGTTKTSLCCASAGDFPNLCLVGACGCSPTNSHQIKVCDCGEGKCFDGKRCTIIGGKEAESYIACGCGCCVGTETGEICLYHSKGDDIQKIIDADKKQAQSPACSTVGCSFPIKYIYCD